MNGLILRQLRPSPLFLALNESSTSRLTTLLRPSSFSAHRRYSTDPASSSSSSSAPSSDAPSDTPSPPLPTPQERVNPIARVESSRITQKQQSLHADVLRSRQSFRKLSRQQSPTSSSSSSPPSSDWRENYANKTKSESALVGKYPTVDNRWAQQSPVRYTEPVTTTSARSFAVGKFGLAGAFRNLNKTLRENNIRKELKQKDRFESGSDKRVRLDSERHRRRFKVAVGKAVSLAMRNV